MSDDRIRITYYVGDGSSRAMPQAIEIDEGEIPYGITDEDLEDLLDELIEADMQARIHPSCDQQAMFVGWAREVIAKRGNE